MFMETNNNTQSYHCQYANVFANKNTDSYIIEMTDMRKILTHLMAQAGDDAYSLETKSGVPQPTTQRFLSRKHGDPRSSTVRKWAAAYRVTESQLRGDVPIEGVTVDVVENGQSQRRSDELLSKEQKQILSLAKSFDAEARRAWIGIGKTIAQLRNGDRRHENIGHNPETMLDNRTYAHGPDLSNTYDKPQPSESSQKGRKRQ